MSVEEYWTLGEFVAHALDDAVLPKGNSFETDTGCVVRVARPLYGDARVGMSHFECLRAGRPLGEAFMRGPADAVELGRLAALIAPGRGAGDILGTLGSVSMVPEGNPFRNDIYAFAVELGRPPNDLEVTGILRFGSEQPSPVEVHLASMDVFALRQVTYSPPDDSLPSRGFFEEQVASLLEWLAEDADLADEAFERALSELAAQVEAVLERSTSLPSTWRAKRLADGLILSLSRHGLVTLPGFPP